MLSHVTATARNRRRSTRGTSFRFALCRIDRITQPGIDRPTPPHHDSSLQRRGQPYPVFVALAVAVLLLLSTPVSAQLVEEVPLDHWSYAALERLAAAGLVDPSRYPVSPRHPLTRYQLASATKEALEHALALADPDGRLASVAEDLRALAQEFAQDISRLGGLRVDVVQGTVGGSGLTAADAQGGVGLDAIRAVLETERNDAAYHPAGTGHRTTASETRRSAPAEYDLAAYDLGVLGLRMKTTLSMEERAQGEGSVSAARLKASLQLPERRGEIEAGYALVDVDRLRELSSGAVGGGEANCSDDDCQEFRLPRFHVAGVAPLGDAVSVRVGYELWTAGAFTPTLESVVGAGLEYSLGERANVTAGVRWAMGSGSGHGEAGVGIGYRLGDSASLVASYSLLSFENAKEATATGLGEAELEIRF